MQALHDGADFVCAALLRLSARHYPAPLMADAIQQVFDAALERFKKQVQADADAKIEEAKRALETLRSLGLAAIFAPEEGELTPAPALPRKVRMHRIKTQEKLPAAIDKALPTSGTGLTAREIADVLKAGGRVFSVERPETLVSSALSTRHKAMGWTSDSGYPQRWRKKGGASS